MIGYSNEGLLIETIDLNERGVIEGDDEREDELDKVIDISFCSS